MKLQVNGSSLELDPPLSLSDLLARHKLKPEAVVVEWNLKVPRKEDYASILLSDGDKVEIVKFMGGG